MEANMYQGLLFSSCTFGDSHSWGQLHLRKVPPHRLHQPESGHHGQQTALSGAGHLRGKRKHNEPWLSFILTTHPSYGKTWHICLKILWSWCSGHQVTCMQCSILTLIGSEFTVSGFDRSHEVRGNYHWCEADITVIFPHQGPKGKPVLKTDFIDNRARGT